MRRFENRFRSMKSDDDERRTTRRRLYSAIKKKLQRRWQRWRQRRRQNRIAAVTAVEVVKADTNIYGITCNNAYALPKTTSDLCRQQLMEKRLQASRFCCQAQRVQVAPQSQSQQPPSRTTPLPWQPAVSGTTCPNCPATQQPRPTARGPALALSNGGVARSLPCQALPPPPPCAPQCPPCPPCPPALSAPLKASDYIHTTTECYPTNTKQDPCRWDNTTCYNEGNDSSGNTIRQWNTRCQFASKLNEANTTAAAAKPGLGSASVSSGAAAAVSDVAVIANTNMTTEPIQRTANGRSTINEPSCSHERCRTAAVVSDHCFRKCKKELTIHFPSGKCGTQLQRRRSAKMGNLITPRPSTTTARPDITATTTAAGAVVAAAAELAAARSKLAVDENEKRSAVNDDMLVESPMSTTRAPAYLAATIPLTPMTPASASAFAASVHYRPLTSLIDDDMPPVSDPHQHKPTADRAWLQNQRKLYRHANKRVAGSAEIRTPPLSQSTTGANFYRNDFDWGRVKR